MRKSIVDYKKIWDVYEMKSIKYNTKERNRRQKDLKYIYKKKYKDRAWEDLSELEKDKFIYGDIRDYMLKEYDGHDKKQKYRDEKIVNKIMEKIHRADGDNIQSVNTWEDYIEKWDILYYTEYCKPEDSLDTKRLGYAKFKKNLKKFGEKIPVPSFEEWIAYLYGPKKHPMRVYDWIAPRIYPDNLNDDISYPRHLSVNDVIIRIIVQYLEEYHGLKINIPKIEECLGFLEFFNIDIFDDIPRKEDFIPTKDANITKSEDEITINPEDEITINPEDEITINPEDENVITINQLDGTIIRIKLPREAISKRMTENITKTEDEKKITQEEMRTLLMKHAQYTRMRDTLTPFYKVEKREDFRHGSE